MRYFWPILVMICCSFPFQTLAGGSGCTAAGCHEGIMDIVPPDLPMMSLIRQNGLRHRDMDGCVVCHGGNPESRDRKKAHQGIPSSLVRAPGPKAFYPNPGDLSIAMNTCGVCHPGYVYRVQRSLMNTQAGMIQGNLNTWGTRQAYGVIWGNHDIQDPDGPVPSGTSPAYDAYVQKLSQAFPGVFPEKLAQLPLPSLEEIEAEPAKAAFIYQRRECQGCHVNVQGEQMEGRFRGTGCAACHMPYGPDGIYRGEDATIPRDQGHILRHRIVGNRKTLGIPVSTCQSCHNRGKRIGTSFEGVMESPFEGPFDPKGETRPRVHGKFFLPVQEDLHHRTESRPGNPQGSLLCQDCHTSMDIHGDGNIKGTTLAQVEIECTDCHGTPDRFPWELPLGHGDEFGLGPKADARGTVPSRLLSDQQFGFDHDPADGYLVSTRGNPFGNVVRKGNQVLVHSAAGKDFFVPVLKGLAHGPGREAMVSVPAHLERMECYACHATWTPQCYGCHIKLDFSDPEAGGTDWVKVSNPAAGAGETAMLPGKIEERLSYQRWETPVLGINGEGRISPLMPGGQPVITLISQSGKRLAAGHMPGNPLEAAAAGQSHIPMALDMAPAQPHTSDARARSCESCHACPKTLGLGIGNFKTFGGLPFDWSQILDANGVQLATVGTHWPGSRAFNGKELNRILKTGTCLGCHKFQDLSRKWKALSNQEIQSPEDHARLLENMGSR